VGLIPVRKSAFILSCVTLLGLLTIPVCFAGIPEFLENGTPGSPELRASQYTATSTRKLISLNGLWTYALENGSTGNVSLPVAFDGRGAVDFQRGFEMPAFDLDRYQWHIVVLGANYGSDISVNSDFLGHHAGGYTSYSLPIPRISLQPGRDNILKVVVSNELDGRTTVPLHQMVWGWRNYGGIHRDIALLGTPLLYIRDVTLTSAPAGDGMSYRLVMVPEIEGAVDSIVRLTSGDKKAILGMQVEIVENLSGAVAAQSALVPVSSADGKWLGGRTEVVVPGAKIWSPDAPDLYTVKCRLVLMNGKNASVIDEVVRPYGFRSLVVDKGDLVLNGKRFIARGVTWYEDHPAWGNAIPYEERERDIVAIKMLGANVIRFIGHPPHPVMLDLCDRYGIFAMIELPVIGVPAAVLSQESYQETSAGMLREMIVRDRHHPSVLSWGLGDEIESNHVTARPFVSAMVAVARALDSRPLYLPVRVGVVDSTSDLVDIAAVSLYDHDAKTMKLIMEDWRKEHPGVPVFVTRLGMEVDQENKRGYNDPLSQQAQARFFNQRLDLLRTFDPDGTIILSYNDWRGDRPALTVRTGDPWMHRMGLVSDRREKRLAYDAVRAIFRGEKPAALPAGTYSSRMPIIFVLAGFVILIAVAYLYNVNRRFRECVNRSLMNSFNFYADVRDQHAVSLLHTTFLALIVSVSLAIVASSVLYRFRDSLFLDDLLTYVLVLDSVKAGLIHLVWQPLQFILAASVFIFVVLILLSGLVHMAKLIVRSRVFAYQAYTATIWSMTPLLAFIPLGMILYRVLEGSMYALPAFVLIAVFLLWVIARLFKGISIIYDIYPPKLYAAGVLALLAGFGMLYLYYDLVQSAPMHLSFLYSMVGSGR
jgi:beta-glucuronidase